MGKSNTDLFYENIEIKVSDKDKADAQKLLKNKEHRGILMNDMSGFRVVKDEKVMRLAAALYPHKADEVVRPKNGDWFDVRRCNLRAVKIDAILNNY